MLDLEAIETRLAAATPGPWHLDEEDDGDGWWASKITDTNDDVLFDFDGDELPTPYLEDARFIAHAPTDIAALIAEVEQLRVEKQGLLDAVDNLTTAIFESADKNRGRVADATDSTSNEDAASTDGEG